MNPIAKSFIVVSILLFVTAFMPTPQLRAAIFEGSETSGEHPYGFCLDHPDHQDCIDIDCSVDRSNPLCISETQIGTGIARESLTGTGITHTEDFGDYIKKIVNFSLPYLVLAAFLGYVVAGFMYVTAFGNDEQMQKAKKILVWVSIGLILVILSYAIVNLLTSELIRGLGGEDQAEAARRGQAAGQAAAEAAAAAAAAAGN
ncbi:hypothetical protein JXD20_04370 [Candidatus Peregrinibacteria bacterium]|nr:hypothetical protein [Candidatus Peregrinibacteria bacterium]